MQNISIADRTERIRLSYFFIAALIIISSLAIFVLGAKGLLLSILALSLIIITPFIINKPTLFMTVSLFIYPLTRFLPLDDKFIITGLLYVTSFPAAICLIGKLYSKVSSKSLYLWAMVGYILVILLNLFRPGADFSGLLKEFGRTFYGIFIVLAVFNYAHDYPERIRKMCYGISYLLNFIALGAMVQYIFRIGGYVVEGLFRVNGTFNNFNEYGYVISMFICFAMYNLISSETTKQRAYWIGSIVLNILAMALTLSKTSVITTAFVFLALGLILPIRTKLKLIGAFLVISIFSSVLLVTTGTIQNLILRFGNNTSLDWRFDMWHKLYFMIIQGNVLLGQGANASRDFLQLILPAGESTAPHNIYLETTYNYGLVGLIPFVFTFILLAMKGFKILIGNKLKKNQNKLLGTTFLVITLITFIQNFVSNAFYDRAVSIIFWAVITLLVCWYDYYTDHQQSLDTAK